jgi:hypothetical protein
MNHYCLSHKRIASALNRKGGPCCDPSLGGITAICQTIPFPFEMTREGYDVAKSYLDSVNETTEGMDGYSVIATANNLLTAEEARTQCNGHARQEREAGVKRAMRIINADLGDK